MKQCEIMLSSSAGTVGFGIACYHSVWSIRNNGSLLERLSLGEENYVGEDEVSYEIEAAKSANIMAWLKAVPAPMLFE